MLLVAHARYSESPETLNKLRAIDTDDIESPIGIVAMGKRLTQFLRQSPAHRQEQGLRDRWAKRNVKK